MNRYNIYCTNEQTEAAYRLGAPLYNHKGVQGSDLTRTDVAVLGDITLIKPTTHQMINWLEKKGAVIEVCRLTKGVNRWAIFINNIQEVGIYFDNRAAAELAGIDAALVYLKKGI